MHEKQPVAPLLKPLLLMHSKRTSAGVAIALPSRFDLELHLATKHGAAHLNAPHLPLLQSHCYMLRPRFLL
jgi:hypothetical protein